MECHEIDTEAVLYDPVLNTTYRLNDTAYLVWQLSDGVRDVTTIAEAMQERYDVTLDRALADVERIVAEMSTSGLLNAMDRELS